MIFVNFPMKDMAVDKMNKSDTHKQRDVIMELFCATKIMI